MGRGRKAIPADLKDNSTYKDVGAIQRQQDLTPKVDSAKLMVPRSLTPGAKEEWRRVVKLYRELSVEVLNDLDRAVLTMYCAEVDITQRLYDAWLKEDCKLITTDQATGATVETTATGKPIKGKTSTNTKQVVNPLLREYNRHAQTVRVLAEQLALTPAGRAAYAVRKEKEIRSPAEDFMGDE